MPTNLFGPNDNFDLETSHVVPALIRKFHEAKSGKKKKVILWGSGNAYREFLYVDDLAYACIFLMQKYNDSETINIGKGKDITIHALAQLVKKIVGFKGRINWDRSKPDGTPRKKLDISKLQKLGWKPQTSLTEGIKITYRWYLENHKN